MGEMVAVAVETGRYVQYGCGLCAPQGWMNFDASPRLRFERMPVTGSLVAMTKGKLFPANVMYGDIRQGLPVADGSVDGVYASHILEHLSRNAVVAALANTHKILRSGGVFRVIVPDLAARAERYVRDRAQRSPKNADAFITALNIGEMDRAQGVAGLLRSTFGHSGHLWMYDEDLMGELLRQAGFIDVRRATFGDSGDKMFDIVEDRGRFFDSGEPELAMQAKKA